MAKAKVELPDELITRIAKLGSDEGRGRVIEAVLRAGAEVSEPKVQAGLEKNTGHKTKYPPRSTGELIQALGISPVSTSKTGRSSIKVGFSENRSDGGINALIANVLEHGRKNADQKGRKVFAGAGSRSRKAAIDAMEDEFDRQINNMR